MFIGYFNAIKGLNHSQIKYKQLNIIDPYRLAFLRRKANPFQVIKKKPIITFQMGL